jgi:hypothetical protein
MPASVALVIASARSLPALTCSINAIMFPKIKLDLTAD